MRADILAASVSGPTHLDVLTLLVTTEGLLFAALTIGVSMSASSAFKAKTLVPPDFLVLIAAAVLCIVGSAAVLAWKDLFLANHWPSGKDSRLEAVALLFPIVAQPLIAVGVRRQ